MNGKHVFVGLSGGVDSSVAAARLIDAGYRVTGVFIKVWHPDFLTCNWEEERTDSMRVCATLGIPFLTCDATERYRQDVAEYLINEYRAGRTPNPDVMCNTQIKFGAFIEFADAYGADFVATGHYAQRRGTHDAPELWRGADVSKDQSYFLYALTREQLARALFPIGDTEKEAVRREAAHRGLATAKKPDSQGVCFLGQLDMKSFLQHFIEVPKGILRDIHGKEIGVHDGALFYTIGQRHGFTITAPHTARTPHYVVVKDTDKNELVVSPEKPLLTHESHDALRLGDVVWRGATEPYGTFTAQTRYRQEPFAVDVEKDADTNELIVTPQKDTDMPAAGQSCVLYDSAHCVGGGIIR